MAVVPAAAVDGSIMGDVGSKAQFYGRVSVCVPFITLDAWQVQPV